MESPVTHTGWSGFGTHGSMEAPRTIERKRRGRNVDVMSILPTPPRSREVTHLPTPETIRQPRKPITKHAAAPSQSTALPTPQTLPRHGRKKSLEHSVESQQHPPSPSGHTTFFLSSASAAPKYDHVIRRRPGLTFAQQMGLVQSQAGPSTVSTSSGARLGLGVGMGGSRAREHAKSDQVAGPRLDEPIQVEEENPFLSTEPAKPSLGLPLSSPGFVTGHLPRTASTTDEEGDHDMAESSPLQRRVSNLVTPPPTQQAARVLQFKTPGPSRQQQEASEREKKRQEDIKRMMDEDDNPFLARPGEVIRPHREEGVDESRPYVTYVFRGAKKVFGNPFYPADQRYVPAELDTEHPEYDAHPGPAPKLLWPSAPSPPATRETQASSPPSDIMQTPQTSRRKPFANVQEEYVEEEDEDLPVRRGMLFAPSGGTKRSNDSEDEKNAKKSKGLKRL